MGKQYVIRFANELNNFRKMEFESLTSLFELNFKYIESITEKPYMIIEINDDDDDELKLLKIFKRMILATDLFECFINAQNFENFFNEINDCNQRFMDKYENSTFRIQVETFGKKITQQEKIERIERLSGLNLHGQIRMNDPDVQFYYMEYWGLDPNRRPEEPYQVLFGRFITNSNRKLLSEFSLRKRKFIANTSMNVTLSFLMCNVANVVKNDLVYDPFVGSGSLLVSAAYHGAYVCGTDIDYQLLHAQIKPTRMGNDKRSDDESIFDNLKQYGLQSKYLDVIAADSSRLTFHENLKFDSIITDPPYGIRESRERIGTKKSDPTVPIEYLDKHLPAKLQYKIDDIYTDLLNFSAKYLKHNGIVTFWAPFHKEFIQTRNLDKKFNVLPQIDKLPQININYDERLLRDQFKHKQLRLLSFGEQKLTKNCSRILIVMKKIC